MLGTPYDQAGVLGQPGTSVLFGGEFDDDASEGVRGTVGLAPSSGRETAVRREGSQWWIRAAWQGRTRVVERDLQGRVRQEAWVEVDASGWIAWNSPSQGLGVLTLEGPQGQKSQGRLVAP